MHKFKSHVLFSLDHHVWFTKWQEQVIMTFTSAMYELKFHIIQPPDNIYSLDIIVII